MSLAEKLSAEYLSYAYSYPHKTAYRPLSPPVALEAAWAEEEKHALFVYLHVPFCEQRCGFCNLYTQVQPKEDTVAAYLDTLERQATATLRALGGAARFARYAVGGGTPSFLEVRGLQRLFGVLRRLGAEAAPGSVEVSPGTADAEKLALLVDEGVYRVSIGVQSLDVAEMAAVARGQDPANTLRLIEAAAARFPVCNVDLIYGLPGQHRASLERSIDAVIRSGANELYLYPLYVRPLTGLGRTGWAPSQRLALYRAGREHLLGLGWTQHSTRFFRAPGAPSEAHAPTYRCQDDGMIGLGPGARSYTRRLHYASPYATSQGAIRTGVSAWISQSEADFGWIGHGIWLSAEEQRRRFVLLSLLDRGVEESAYRHRFGGELRDELPELVELLAPGLAEWREGWLTLTAPGIERADVLGEWLQSEAVRRLRAEWTAA